MVGHGRQSSLQYGVPVGAHVGVSVGDGVGVSVGVDVDVGLGVSVTSKQSQQLLPWKDPHTLTEPLGHVAEFWMHAPHVS